MSVALPISSRDCKVRNRTLVYGYLLGQMAAAHTSPPNDYDHYQARITAWRINAERLSSLLGRNLTLDLQDMSLHPKVETPWNRRAKRAVKYMKFRINLF